MPRWDYDVVFYRVFCVTLLGIAFTFTIILTNVYIDIDGLLAHKEDKHISKIHEIADIPDDIAPSPADGDDMNYGDNDDGYRKTQNILFHIKNPIMKNLLTNRLETLLEALDAKESFQGTKVDKDSQKNEIKDVPKEESLIIDENKSQETKLKRHKDEEMLHLTMHNILLQGIIGHMDIGEVYKRVQSMMNSLNKVRRDEQVNDKIEDKSNKIQSEEAESKKSISNRFVAELFRCNHLQDQILNGATKKVTNKINLNLDPANLLDGLSLSRKGTQKKNMPPNLVQEKSHHTGPNVFIKTTVDINAFASESNDTVSKENLHGIIEVIYNGKSLKFTRANEEGSIAQNNTAVNMMAPIYMNTITNKHPEITSQAIPLDTQTFKEIPKNYINRFVAEYFNHFPTENKQKTKEHIESKRIKRHVKIKFDQEKKATHFLQQTKPNVKKASDDDELYVEIETHFDSKGFKGEKKKKLIRSLIDKIQKAIHSEEIKKIDHDSKKSKDKALHVRKRLQDPLEHKILEQKSLELESKYMVPVSNIIHRQLNPIVIPQTVPSDDIIMPKVRDRSGEAWKKAFVGPTFLTATKSINSAEMSEVEVDYNRVLDVNGIPQRLQKPLNTDSNDEKEKPNSYFDLGNMKFFIKDVDGSGFSIGFNQYVDEPPDPETIKLFTGLENVIKTYHQNIDQIQEEPQAMTDFHDGTEFPVKNDHIIVRRSANHKHDYHSNEYKIIYNSNFLPYNDYKDIYGQENSKTNIEYRTSNYHKPLIVDEHIFDKNLKPSEIFGLANLFRRKKRAIKVRKISNLKSKIKLNRFLNTKAMATKRIFLKKKRHKRQISKIRIIASDLPYKRSSDENVFLVSSENIFADRPFVKDVEASEADGEKMEETDYIPYQSEESISPDRLFESKSRRNNLMSKYPHIFMEEIAKSKEDFSVGPALLLSKIPVYKNEAETGNAEYDFLGDNSSINATTEMSDKIQGVEDIVNALQYPKTNYKVTLKVLPKNRTSDMNPGFKEIHTSINKRYNKNGIMYTSLVNVSEISKITNVNKTKILDYSKADTDLAKKVKDQHDKVQTLLKQHRKYINEQLAKLSEEKSNIEAILIDENNTVVPHFDYLNVMMPSKQNKVLHMSRDEVNNMVQDILNIKYVSTTSTKEETSSTAKMTSKSTTPSTAPQITTTSILTTNGTKNSNKNSTTIQNSSTTTLPLPSATDRLKNNLLSTIERNEKLTDQILQKIDINTEILQTFLKKFTNAMDTQKVDRRTKTIIKDEKSEKPIPKIDHNLPFSVDWRQQGTLPFNPNTSRKNNSQITIPFFYAYQHPIMPSKINSPVASVVYHGTIHTNSIHPKDLSVEREKVLPRHKIINSNNQTRFFIDEVGNDYKVIPVNRVIDKHPLFKNMTSP